MTIVSATAQGRGTSRYAGARSDQIPVEGLTAVDAERLQWDRHCLQLALKHSELSKDPETRVGALIAGPHRDIRAMGFNRFPEGIAETPERLNDRELKLKIMVHAERYAILNAVRAGIALEGCTLYLAATDDSGLIWGGPPCTSCTIEVIAAGIAEIVAYPVKPVPSKWHENLRFARGLLEEKGIRFREIPV